ncbi:MAG: hypothetical protein BJ554DRAFT_7867, partial [Olpidium bornovanus]
FQHIFAILQEQQKKKSGHPTSGGESDEERRYRHHKREKEKKPCRPYPESDSEMEDNEDRLTFSMIKLLPDDVQPYERHGGPSTLEVSTKFQTFYKQARQARVKKPLLVFQAIEKLTKSTATFQIAHDKKICTRKSGAHNDMAAAAPSANRQILSNET